MVRSYPKPPNHHQIIYLDFSNKYFPARFNESWKIYGKINMNMSLQKNSSQTGNLWILSGSRGSGKTTLCQRLAAEARALDWDVAGVISPAVFNGSEKTGIEVLDLRSGESRQFARRPLDPLGKPTAHSGWVYDQIALAWGNEVLEKAIPCDMLVVDEMGLLEFETNCGWKAGLAAVDSRSYRVGLVTIRPELLAAARKRWPFAGVVDMESPEGFFEPLEGQTSTNS